MMDGSSNSDRTNKPRGSFELTRRMEKIKEQVQDFVNYPLNWKGYKELRRRGGDARGEKRFCVGEGIDVMRDGG